MATYAERATAYAHRVVGGEEVAGLYERLACARFLRDLEQQGTEAFPYVFSADVGGRACRFIELLPHIKGEWAKPVYVDGQMRYTRIVLEDWQVFIVMNLFAWLNQATGLRRFIRAYEEVARKNAKSTLAAGILLFMLVADSEAGAHVYSAATTGDQAREVFDVARNMAMRDPEFLLRFGVDVGKHDITVADTASSAKPLNAEGSTLDGLNVHAAVVDELHAHKTRAVYDVLDSAIGARSQPLILMITTAGTDRNGICYEQRTYTIKVLEGTLQDETWFGIIFTLDKEDLDDWHNPALWRKANPNLGVSVKLDKMESAAKKARSMPSAQSNFMTKLLNIWVGAGSQWMNMLEWDACANPALTLESMRGVPCWIGMDLAEKKDFAALALVFNRDGVWSVITRLYLNRAAIEASNNAHLAGWVEEGFVQTNDGNITDLDMLKADLLAYQQTFQLQEVAYDPARSMYFAIKLQEAGLPLVEIPQAAKYFTQPLIVVENMVLERKLQHDGNKAMNWMVSNVVARESKFTKLKHPIKEREENKIDGPIAMFMACGRAINPDEVMVFGDDYELLTV